MRNHTRNGLIALALIVIAVSIANRQDAPGPVPDPCGTEGTRRCKVPPPPCEAAGTRDRNPGDRRVSADAGPLLRDSTSIPLRYGFNDAAPLIGQLTVAQDLQLQRTAGSSLIRVILDWGAVEAIPNEFDFSTPDEIYCEALASGIEPLFSLTGVPPWSLGDSATRCEAAPCVQPPDPAHYPALRRFSELVAIRYPKAAAIEVWNEPNFGPFWPNPDPARYTDVVREVYEGVKSGVPRLPVLAGSVTNAPNDDERSGSLSMYRFLSEMFEAGAARYMDALSIHAYPIGRIGATDDLLTPQVATALGLAEELVSDRAIGLWLTETGIPTEEGAFAPARTEEEQAADLATVYQQLSELPRVEAVLFHTLVDPNSAVPGGPGFGWFTEPEDGQVRAKPVVCTFRVISGLAGCPTNVLIE